MLSLNFYRVRQWAYLYMALPVLCFLGLYIHSFWGAFFLIFAVIALISLLFHNRKEQLKAQKDITVSIKWLLFFAGAAILWSYLGGQGNLFFQNSDWNYRNAIFRDLVYYDWPVTYPAFDKALVYYISYWLPSAAITKILGILFPVLWEGEKAFKLANLFLWGWTSLGIFLVELLLVTYIKPKKKRDYLIIVAVLILFSGLDIIGAAYQHITKGIVYPDMHFEWWAETMQFSSLTTCLFWVFNQAVIPWIAILCLLQEKQVRDYVFLGVCAFATGPMPFLGIFVYMIAVAAQRFIRFLKERDIKAYLKEIFSFSNCCSTLIFVPYILYYMSNTALMAGVKDAEGITFLFFELVPVSTEFLLQVAGFWILEAGIYFAIVYKYYKNDLFYWTTIVVTLIAPFIKMGTSIDFVMRFSIPAIMLTAVMCMNYLINGREEKGTFHSKACCIAMIVCLSLGSVTAVSEIGRGIHEVMKHGRLPVLYDSIKTLNREEEDINFASYEYDETLFFKYIVQNVK